MICFLVVLFILEVASAVDPPYGQLSVKGTQLVGQNGQAVQLRGMSLFWSNWMGQFWNAETVNSLKKCWNANIVRAPMGIEPDGAYLSNPDKQKQLLYAVVDAAIAAGIYVLIDWHEENADQHKDKAIAFFKEVSAKYGKVPNVLYETWNEPTQKSWSQVLKPYHEDVIKAIRGNDPKNVIICGTPVWDQSVDEAANDQIKDATNIMYTLHFYAASHKQDLRDKANTALSKGLPIFVTEYGMTPANGDGAVDAAETQKWWDWMDEKKISYCNWAIDDKAEQCAALTPGSTSKDLCDASHYTTSGKAVNAHLKGENNGVGGGGAAGGASGAAGSASGAAGSGSSAAGTGSGASGSGGSAGSGSNTGSGGSAGGAGSSGSGASGAAGSGSNSGSAGSAGGAGSSGSGGSGAAGSGSGGASSGGDSGAGAGSGGAQQYPGTAHAPGGGHHPPGVGHHPPGVGHHNTPPPVQQRRRRGIVVY